MQNLVKTYGADDPGTNMDILMAVTSPDADVENLSQLLRSPFLNSCLEAYSLPHNIYGVKKLINMISTNTYNHRQDAIDDLQDKVKGYLRENPVDKIMETNIWFNRIKLFIRNCYTDLH